jgi:hypothetical protein
MTDHRCRSHRRSGPAPPARSRATRPCVVLPVAGLAPMLPAPCWRPRPEVANIIPITDLAPRRPCHHGGEVFVIFVKFTSNLSKL